MIVFGELLEGNINEIILDMGSVNLIFEYLIGFFVENFLFVFWCVVGLEICYICSWWKLKEFMRSVYIRL